LIKSAGEHRDPQVQRMLATREDVFADYSLDGFRAAIGQDSAIVSQEPIPGTARTLFGLEVRT